MGPVDVPDRRPPGSTAGPLSARPISGGLGFGNTGVEFIALNGGPEFRFTEAVSLSVSCHSQEELDELWDKLSAGGNGAMNINYIANDTARTRIINLVE